MKYTIKKTIFFLFVLTLCPLGLLGNDGGELETSDCVSQNDSSRGDSSVVGDSSGGSGTPAGDTTDAR